MSGERYGQGGGMRVRCPRLSSKACRLGVLLEGAQYLAGSLHRLSEACAHDAWGTP